MNDVGRVLQVSSVETAVFGVRRHCNVNEQEDNNCYKKSLTYVTYLELQKCI